MKNRSNIITIDNGSTGGICITTKSAMNKKEVRRTRGIFHVATPTWGQQNYQTTSFSLTTRIDRKDLKHLLSSYNPSKTIIITERPNISSLNINSTIASHRSFEALLTVLEDCELEYFVIDSKLWQRTLCPELSIRRIKGEVKMKDATKIAVRKFLFNQGYIHPTVNDDSLAMNIWAREHFDLLISGYSPINYYGRRVNIV